MKLKTIIMLSLLGCIWGWFGVGPEFTPSCQYSAHKPLFFKFNPQFIETAESEGYQLVFDAKDIRIGFVVTEKIRLQIKQRIIPPELSEDDIYREVRGIAQPIKPPVFFGDKHPELVPSVGDVLFDWSDTSLRSLDPSTARWTAIVLGGTVGAGIGFLCPLIVLLLMKAITSGLRRSCNKIQLYLSAVFIPLIPGLCVFGFRDGDDGVLVFLVSWLILVFIFEFMLFASLGSEKTKRSKDKLLKNVESSATSDAVERYEAEMLPHPPGIKPPEHYGYIHYKAYSYLKKGPAVYRRQDAFGMPSENTPLSILSVIEQGCRQIQEWKGITPESPLKGLGINGFYRLIELFHFKVVGQSASFGDDGTVMDKMTIKHAVSDWELTLYNMVNSPAKSKKNKESLLRSVELNAESDRAGRNSKQNATQPTDELDSMLTSLYSGGDGNSPQDAVVVNAPSSSIGVLLEYKYIQKQCGEKDVDWRIESQSLLDSAGGKPYDLMAVRLKDGTTREFYFDISSFYGRHK